MKTIKVFIAFVAMVNIGHPLSAQSNFKKGFVIANGDTLHGLIDYRQWEKNPREIKFKNDQAANAVKYTTGDISYFEIYGSDKYEKAMVNKDMRTVNIRDLTEFTEDIFVDDTVFLRILVKGNISLYQLTDDKNHFYIKVDGKNFQELIYKVYLTDGINLSRHPVYIDQLLRFVDQSKGNTALSSRIQRADYKEGDLIKIVEQLNSQDGEAIHYTVKKTKHPISFFVGAGAISSSLKFKGENVNASEFDYNKSIQPLFTTGIDISILRNLQDLIFRAELSYFNMQFSGSGKVSNPPFTKQASYQLKVNAVSPSVSLLYNVFNSSGNKVYVGLGAACNFSSYPQNLYREVPDNIGEPFEDASYFPLEKVWISSHVKAGWIINKKIEIAGSLKIGGTISNFLSHSVSAGMNSLSVNYHF